MYTNFFKKKKISGTHLKQRKGSQVGHQPLRIVKTLSSKLENPDHLF